MKKIIIFCILIAAGKFGFGQTNHHFDNEFGTWKGRTDYFNWKIFLNADAAYLKTIKQVEYNLDPSFKSSRKIVKFSESNPNFTLCSNGWGEFTIRIRIVFKNSKTTSLNEVYRLDLHSPARKKSNYKCP